MKTTEALNEIMTKKDIGTNALAKRLNKTPRLVSERIHQENISVAKLNELLRLLDYKIIIVPNDTRHIEGGIEIE